MSKVSISGNASGTGTFTIASPNSNTDRTINLPDSNGTILTTATAGVPVNGPAFSAYQSASQTFTGNAFTKVTLDVEEFDTNSNFASSRFTPTLAGYYQINGAASANANLILASLFKNGVEYKRGVQAGSNAQTGLIVSTLVYLNGSTDYVELYAYASLTGGSQAQTQTIYLNGFLARSA